jgi:uncharacterized metal-binding protein
MSSCAICDVYACRVGRDDLGPDDCPMRGPFPQFDELYPPGPGRDLAFHAARVEAEGYGRWTRLREVAELAHRSGWRRIGIAHCPGMDREGRLAAGFLARRGFEVVLPVEAGACDPVGQAELFRSRGTELNAIAGMCVGHDTLFLRHAGAPSTSLVARDLRLRHNPVAALWLRSGYLRDALRGPASGPDPFADPARGAVSGGWDDDALARAAGGVRDAAAARRDPPCRLEEAMDFARRLGARRLGVVYCSGFREEARALHHILVANRFEVSSVCCKSGAVPKERLGIAEGEKVRPGRPEMVCNPVAQADVLESDGAELALLMGQCVGHDSATISRLGIPAVCLVAKDRVLGHNTVAALYELEDGAGQGRT